MIGIGTKSYKVNLTKPLNVLDMYSPKVRAQLNLSCFH